MDKGEKESLITVLKGFNLYDTYLKDCKADAFKAGMCSGVTIDNIDSKDMVTYIVMPSQNINGHISTEIGQLKGLTTLVLEGNQITGLIPTEIGLLKNLAGGFMGDYGSLMLSQNQLTGNIPTELGQLSALNVLELNQNQLTGPIPTELGQLNSLTTFALDQNQLTGPIPTELGQLNSLTRLFIFSNQLTGPIPTELGKLTKVQKINLSSNCLTLTPEGVTAIKGLPNYKYCSPPKYPGNLYTSDGVCLDNNCIPTDAFGLKGVIHQNCKACKGCLTVSSICDNFGFDGDFLEESPTETKKKLKYRMYYNSRTGCFNIIKK